MSKEYLTFENGWQAAFDYLASYIEAEVCPVTGGMIRRMKSEKWRFMEQKKQSRPSEPSLSEPSSLEQPE